MPKLSLNSVYDFLGQNKNSATLISCMIAVFKGTFRPIFTMMDKSQDPKTKKFAAIREGLTEVAALPLYAITPMIAGKLVDKFYKGKDAIKRDRVITNGKFIGVGLATILVPFVCNLIQPPIMKAIKEHAEKKANLATQDLPKINQPITKQEVSDKPKVASFSANNVNYGMKVGGC
ncbi:hypothetical protein KBA27_00770 [bacterium]|nr:hypothetical protein [bacterium]